MKGWEFQKLCWRIQREMRHNRKPIILFFGGGYESQILLAILLKLCKKFLIVHNVLEKTLAKKVQNVLVKSNQPYLLLHAGNEDKEIKTWHTDPFCFEKMLVGFSHKHYLLVAGFKLAESYQIKAYHRGFFDNLYCPLLRMCDENIEAIYQDLKDTEPQGKFLFENLRSDSHHNLVIV